MGAAVTSFALVLLIAPYCIEKLQRMKFGQMVRDDGPAAHLIKTGTPTMGGIFLWAAVTVSALLWGAWNGFVLISCLTVDFTANSMSSAQPESQSSVHRPHHQHANGLK